MNRITKIVSVIIAISIMAAALPADEGDKYFEFLRSVYNKHEKKNGDFLIHEIENFTKIYSEHGMMPEVSHLLAEVYLEQGEKDEAFAQMIKTLFLYPNSSIHTTVVGDAHKIFAGGSRYKNKAKYIADVIDGQFTQGSRSEKYFKYLDFLYEIDQKKLYDWALDEYYYFVSEFPSNEKTEKVERWIADTWADSGNDNAAVNGYLKYEELYPGSRHLPYVMIKRAIILSRELKEPSEAIELLSKVAEDYPETDYAAGALFERGQIKLKKNKDYEGAIADFREMTRLKPQHINAVDAFMEIARINEKKLKAYKTAILVYDEISQNYPLDIRGTEALRESAEIYLRLDDYLAAANQYAKITTQFPDYEDSPKMAFKAADIVRSKLKDLNKSIEYLEIIVNQYPDSEASRKAEENISKLRAKLNK